MTETSTDIYAIGARTAVGNRDQLEPILAAARNIGQEAHPSDQGASRLSRILVDYTDPPIAATLSTGGFYPLVRTTLLALGHQPSPRRSIVIDAGRGNVSSNPQWALTSAPTWSGQHPLALDMMLLWSWGAVIGQREGLERHSRSIAELLYDTAERAQAELVPAVVHRQSPERQAAEAIRDSLGWSESALAGLFGVTRQAWRAWVDGSALPRERNSRRIYLLRHVLEVRGRVASSQLPSEWLLTPIGPGRNETPADLFRERRHQLLAAAAAESVLRSGDGIILDAADHPENINLRRVQQRVRDASIVGAEELT